MDIKEVSVPIECFPRYQYMVKERNDLARRFNTLRKTYKHEMFLLGEISNNNIRIKFCKSAASGGSFPDITSIIPRHCDKITMNVHETGNFGKRNELLTNTHFILLQDISSCVKKFPMNTIIIGKDLKAKNILSTVFKSHKNVDVCTEEDIRQTLSTNLERYALTGMREACENLYSLLNRKPCKDYDAEKERRKGESFSESEGTLSPNQRPQSAKIGNIVVPCSRFFRHASDKNGSSRQVYSELREEKKKWDERKISTIISDKDKKLIERLHEELVGLFNRSLLPVDERPRFDKHMVDEKLLQELRNLSCSIESCGYCFSTLQINVSTKDISEVENDIARIMESHDIAKYLIVSSGIREFSTCKVGQRVKVRNENGCFISGTLGGFSATSSEESEQKWALLSRHVAKCSFDRMLYVGKDDSNHDHCGHIMKEIKEDETNKQYLDIAAASLKKDISIDTNYVTEDGKPVPGRPCLYNPEILSGLKVHVKGASTNVGLGIITMPEHVSVKSDNLDENYIIVEDRNENNAFVQEGDSGAMVLAENPDKYGQEVQLISMVMGERMGQKGSYYTVRLDKGLEQLKSLTNKDFSMC